MTYRRIYAIPDIHGEYYALENAIAAMHKDGYNSAQDLIVFTGDLIDRGQMSKQVLDKVKELVDSGAAKAISGNHESFAIDYYTKNRGFDLWALWAWNGGLDTIESYAPEKQMSEDHIKFLGSLPRSLEIQGFFFSHAPVPQEWERSDKNAGKHYTLHELTWTYFPIEGEEEDMPNHPGPVSECGEGKDHLIGICGHIHRLNEDIDEVRIFPQYRMLDVGCGYASWATLAIHECVENRTFYVGPEKTEG